MLIDEQRLTATCEEMLAFLAAHDEHGKLRRLKEDIEALRDRLLKQCAPEKRGRD